MPDPFDADKGYFRTVFDAFPSPVFVVDQDVRVLEANAAAPGAFGERDVFLKKLCGDMVRCVHCWKTGAACGTTEACKACVVRNSVGKTFAGNQIVRRKTEILQVTNGEPEELHVLVSTSPFEFAGTQYVLLVLEDITELTELRGVIPICCHCGKVRNDDDYWERVESYMSRHLDVGFTHGICPDCLEKHYPDRPE